MKTPKKYWKHVGRYTHPPEGKWINECIVIGGLVGASIVYEAENGASEFLVINGQMFEAMVCDE
jgi:hypothetical protein